MVRRGRGARAGARLRRAARAAVGYVARRRRRGARGPGAARRARDACWSAERPGLRRPLALHHHRDRHPRLPGARLTCARTTTRLLRLRERGRPRGGAVQPGRVQPSARLAGAPAAREGDSPFAPYPARVDRGRVTDETARPSRLLVPDHPLLTTPNRIGPADFAGWVQERGLQFLRGARPALPGPAGVAPIPSRRTRARRRACSSTRRGRPRHLDLRRPGPVPPAPRGHARRLPPAGQPGEPRPRGRSARGDRARWLLGAAAAAAAARRRRRALRAPGGGRAGGAGPPGRGRPGARRLSARAGGRARRSRPRARLIRALFFRSPFCGGQRATSAEPLLEEAKRGGRARAWRRLERRWARPAAAARMAALRGARGRGGRSTSGRRWPGASGRSPAARSPPPARARPAASATWARPCSTSTPPSSRAAATASWAGCTTRARTSSCHRLGLARESRRSYLRARAGPRPAQHRQPALPGRGPARPLPDARRRGAAPAGAVRRRPRRARSSWWRTWRSSNRRRRACARWRRRNEREAGPAAPTPTYPRPPLWRARPGSRYPVAGEGGPASRRIGGAGPLHVCVDGAVLPELWHAALINCHHRRRRGRQTTTSSFRHSASPSGRHARALLGRSHPFARRAPGRDGGAGASTTTPPGPAVSRWRREQIEE